MSEPKILFCTPYSLEKNLGKEYNRIMRLVEHDDDYWVCFTDGDAMFTTSDFGHAIHDIVVKYCHVYGLFTCTTNRIGNKQQLVSISFDDSMIENRHYGKLAWSVYNDKCQNITEGNPLSGVMILISVKTWKAVGGFTEELSILGVDNDIHYRCRTAGIKVGLMNGIYLMHYYRNSNKSNISHLL